MATISIPMYDNDIKEDLLNRYLDVSGIVHAAYRHELMNKEIYQFLFPYICRKIYKHITASDKWYIRHFQSACMWFTYLLSVPSMYVDKGYNTEYVRKIIDMGKDYINSYMLKYYMGE